MQTTRQTYYLNCVCSPCAPFYRYFGVVPPGPGAPAPRAKLGATNAPSWGKATAPKEQAKKASTLAEAAGPGPAMYDTATSWARQEGLGTGPVAPMSGRHAFGSFLPPELAAEKPTEEMVAEQPVGDGKRLRLKALWLESMLF